MAARPGTGETWWCPPTDHGGRRPGAAGADDPPPAERRGPDQFTQPFGSNLIDAESLGSVDQTAERSQPVHVCLSGFPETTELVGHDVVKIEGFRGGGGVGEHLVGGCPAHRLPQMFRDLEGIHWSDPFVVHNRPCGKGQLFAPRAVAVEDSRHREHRDRCGPSGRGLTCAALVHGGHAERRGVSVPSSRLRSSVPEARDRGPGWASPRC